MALLRMKYGANPRNLEHFLRQVHFSCLFGGVLCLCVELLNLPLPFLRVEGFEFDSPLTNLTALGVFALMMCIFRQEGFP